MPPLERCDLLDSAVVWPLLVRGGKNGVPLQQVSDPYGEPIVGLPFQIDVRWVGRQTRMLTANGDLIALDAVAVISEDSLDIPVGSILYHGCMDDVAGTGSFTSPEYDLYQVKLFIDTPDIKNRNHRRKLGLMRFRNTLPTVSTTGVTGD